VRPAFEIVDSRIRGWDIALADTIADNGSAGLFMLGPAARRVEEIDVVGAEMTMTADEVTVSQGRGADCLGSPLAALAWLGNTCLRYGRPLQAGDVVLSGALGPMVPMGAGVRYRAGITGLGELDVTTTGDGL
jgi:2-keto-4-pentenoate hydratase